MQADLLICTDSAGWTGWEVLALLSEWKMALVMVPVEFERVKMVVVCQSAGTVVDLESLQIVYLFGVLRHFQHCTGHNTTGSCEGRGNQYIQLVKVLYCKLLTNGKQLPAFPLEAGPETKP